MSREENFVRVYCEIMGVSESSALSAFMMYDLMGDAKNAEATNSNTGWTALVSRPTKLSAQASPNRSVGERTKGRDEIPGLRHGFAPAPAAA